MTLVEANIIDELAHTIAWKKILVTDEKNANRVFEYRGLETDVRRIARLLKSYGIKAKALCSDEYVEAFKAANRKCNAERIRSFYANLDTELKGAQPWHKQ